MSLPGWLSETVTATMTASADKTDVFDENNYAAFTKVSNVVEKGITYTQADGAFTFDKAGTYEITWNLYVQLGGAGAPVLTMSMEIATVEVWTVDTLLNPAVDPAERSVRITKTVTAGQALHAFINSSSIDTFQAIAGNTMSIKQLAAA